MCSPRGLPNLPERLDELLALLRIAHVKKRQDDHLLAVDIGGKERQWWGLSKHRPHRQLVGGLGVEIPVLLEHALRLGERVDDKAAEKIRTDLVKTELELRDHAEVAAAAAERPEEIRVLAGAGAHDIALGGDDLGGFEVVDRHAVLAAEPAEAPAQRQARDPRGGVDPHRSGEPVGQGRCVEIPERSATLGEGPLRSHIHLHRPHVREIDDEAVVAQRVTGDVVARAADGKLDLIVAGEVDRLDGILRSGATGNDGGTLVHHAVPDLARLFVLTVARSDDLALESLSELFDFRGIWSCHSSLLCGVWRI